MASGSIVIPELRGAGVFLPSQKALQFEVHTHCSVWDSDTRLYVRALTLFSQSLLLQLREGYFWQSLSCPFPCALALTAAVIVPALPKYLGRVWRNQTSELCTQVACKCSLFKCNHPGSVFSLPFAHWAVRNHVLILLGARCPSEAQMEGCFPPSTPSCRSCCCLPSCCLSLIYTELLYWKNLPFKRAVVLYTAHCYLSMDFIIENNETFPVGVKGPFLARMLLMEK